MKAVLNLAVVGVALASLASGCAEEAPPPEHATVSSRPDTVRVALFNIRELTSVKLADTATDGSGSNPQLLAASAIVKRIRPDILVINEIDHVMGEASLDSSARAFARLYLSQGDSDIGFAYSFAAPNNTGIASGLDLNGDGMVAGAAEEGSREYGEDAFGFGTYPGQYSMAVLSSFPLAGDQTRTFRRFRWKDLPGNRMPMGFYSRAVEVSLRLSSKSHWDVPVRLPGRTLHLFVSHPTPPVFDGDEDRNGRRNFDEIGFWATYLDDSPWLYDDNGRSGGYGSSDPFLIVGDLNARPQASDQGYDGIAAVQQLLRHPRVQDTGPRLTSLGALGGRVPGPPDYLEQSTAVFGGGWRMDYLLPSTDITVTGGGVFWPDPDEDPDGAALAEAASDHRMVWLDIVVN